MTHRLFLRECLSERFHVQRWGKWKKFPLFFEGRSAQDVVLIGYNVISEVKFEMLNFTRKYSL